jgi:hypothetical protein
MILLGKAAVDKPLDKNGRLAPIASLDHHRHAGRREGGRCRRSITGSTGSGSVLDARWWKLWGRRLGFNLKPSQTETRPHTAILPRIIGRKRCKSRRITENLNTISPALRHGNYWRRCRMDHPHEPMHRLAGGMRSLSMISDIGNNRNKDYAIPLPLHTPTF